MRIAGLISHIMVKSMFCTELSEKVIHRVRAMIAGNYHRILICVDVSPASGATVQIAGLRKSGVARVLRPRTCIPRTALTGLALN